MLTTKQETDNTQKIKPRLCRTYNAKFSSHQILHDGRLITSFINVRYSDPECVDAHCFPFLILTIQFQLSIIR